MLLKRHTLVNFINIVKILQYDITAYKINTKLVFHIFLNNFQIVTILIYKKARKLNRN